MLAFLLGMLLLAPLQAEEQNRCDDLRDEIRAIDQQVRANQAGWPQLMAKVQEALACYGDDAPQSVYVDEVYALHNLGRRTDAFEQVEAFFERFADTPDAHWFSRMYQWRGYLNYFMGNLAEAAHDYILRLEYAADQSARQRANICLDIGIVFQRFNDYAAAGAYFEQAGTLLDSVQDNTSSTRARWYRFTADLIREEARFDGGLDTTAYRQASRLAADGLALLEQSGTPDDAASALQMQADLLLLLGDARGARAHLQRALRLAAQTDLLYLRAVITLRLARLHLRAGAYDAAERTLHEALALARRGQHMDYERQTLEAFGLLYELQGRLDKAETAYQDAIAVTEAYREALRLTDWSAKAFGEWLGGYRGLVRVQLAQGKHQEAFLAFEQTRARHLQDQLFQLRLSSESVADRVSYDSLITQLIDVRNALAGEALDAQAQDSLSTLEHKLIAEKARFFEAGTSFQTPPLDTLQQILTRRGQIILSYFIDEVDPLDVVLGRTPQSHVFVLRPDTLVVVPLEAPGYAIRALLTAVSPLLTAPDTSPDFNRRQFSLDALHRLYRQVFEPAAAHIPAGSRLAIIPDGPLFMLPFSMLVEAETAARQYQQAPFLLKQHPISVELATALLLKDPGPAPTTTYDILAFGKTDFSDTERPTTYRSESADSAALISLPAVADELNVLRARFRKTQTRLNAQATEAAFFELSAAAKILHLASHTLLRPASPLHNAIVLSKDPARGEYDGIVYLHEIQRLRMAAQLVVLSGCSTARGVLQPGEGMAGLQYAFRAMGVQSSLATSWFVDDQTTVGLMEAFYQNLQRGLPKDVALQEAQLEHLRQADAAGSSPFFWAAPVLYGHAAPLPLKAQPPIWLLWGVPLLIVLGMLYLGARLLRKRSATS